MPVERGLFWNPTKSAWNFEVYHSGRKGYRNERVMMERLEANPTVRKWTKEHGISITWYDRQHHRHTYRPDFLVEYTDGAVGLIEVKGADRLDKETVKRKREAAQRWCGRRGMAYEIAVA